MKEKDPSGQSVDWANLGTPLLTVVVAAFTGKIGEAPGDLSLEKFHTQIGKAFPYMTADQVGSSTHFNTWSARNVIVNRLPEVGSRRLDNLSERLVESGRWRNGQPQSC